MELLLLKVIHSMTVSVAPVPVSGTAASGLRGPDEGRGPRAQAHPKAAGMGSGASGVGATPVLSRPPGLKSGHLVVRQLGVGRWQALSPHIGCHLWFRVPSASGVRVTPLPPAPGSLSPLVPRPDTRGHPAPPPRPVGQPQPALGAGEGSQHGMSSEGCSRAPTGTGALQEVGHCSVRGGFLRPREIRLPNYEALLFQRLHRKFGPARVEEFICGICG